MPTRQRKNRRGISDRSYKRQGESMPVACIVRCWYAFFCTDLAEEPHKHGDFSEKYHECGFVAPLTFSLYWQKICAASVGGSP